MDERKPKNGDESVYENQCDAYELDDPKHPTYRERMLERADALRKERLEKIEE